METFEQFAKPPKVNLEIEQTEMAGTLLESPIEVRVKLKPKPEKRQISFELDNSGDDLIKRYNPRFLGHGGEHFVYEIPDRPNKKVNRREPRDGQAFEKKYFVIKADKRVMHDVLRRDPEASSKNKIEDSPALEAAQETLEYDREVYNKLRKIFGPEHILLQKKYLAKVPVNDDILADIQTQFSQSGSDMLPFVDNAWSLITVQEKAEIPKDSISAQVGNVENRALPKILSETQARERYSRITDQLINSQAAASSDFKPEELKGFFRGRPFEKLLDIAEEDAELKEVLKDFATKASIFAEATGEILDFCGQDNIKFYKKDGHWTYKLIDPIYVLQRGLVKTARSAATASITEGEPPTEVKKSNALVQVMNFTRTVNALTKLMGGNTYFDYLPSVKKRHGFLSVLLPNNKWE